MKKSLPAFRFISIHRNLFPAIPKLNLFLIFICSFLSVTALNAQDYPVPVESSPKIYNSINSFPSPFAIGTRYFVRISVSPNFQLGKSFMETCTITNMGAASPFGGRLIYRNGVLYTWNQNSPFQLWSIDTVTGVNSLVFNMAGIPQSNLTGMCWDGVNMYGVSTTISVSQIFTINMTTGSCTPIGTPSATCAGAVLLFGRSFPGSSMFVCDMVLDNLYRVNKTTGTFTLLGSFVTNINSDNVRASYDNNDFYWVINGELKRTDSTLSGFTTLCSYQSNLPGFVCVPSSSPQGGINTFEVPDHYFLNQNYPNPFNPETIIKFGIPTTENVKLVVYDILGREVKTLLNEVMIPGTYEVNFDASNLSSGIYFYRIETPNFTQMKQMVIMK